MDYGAALSQKGYDVKTCADRFLVYSSAFQTLKIFSVSTVSGTNPTLTHNLGYYAPYLVIDTSTGNLVYNTSGYTEVRQYINSLTITGTGTWTVYIFLDNFSTIAETNINSGTSSGATSTDYGFRISKSGFDVKTCADKDCVISSSFFNQIVHKKGITTAATVSHNLGYIPNFLNYTNPNSNYIYLEGLMGNINATTFTTGLLPNDTSYYIIFKDKIV